MYFFNFELKKKQECFFDNRYICNSPNINQNLINFRNR